MPVTIILLPGAETDLQEIMDWYTEINEVLADDFLH